MKKFSLFLLFAFALGVFLLLKYFGPWESGSIGGPLIHVYLVAENKTLQMPLEDYLVGVLAAEVPARFEEEALKAQAIAARTYALKKTEAFKDGGNSVHPQGEVCTNPGHCQGWLSRKEMKEKWGWLKYREYERKLQHALRETQGVIAKFQGRLIDPVYHSTCGGRTENGDQVWTHSVPYLTSVSCLLDQEAPKYHGEIAVPLNDFLGRLDLNSNAKSFNASSLRLLAKTETGRVKSISVLGKTFSGGEIRSKFGLNSTNFTWEVTKDAVVFHTTGYGHGVGLCQYGANGMAKNGAKAEEILQHYYQGITLDKMY
ncbi:stage II sporulation protein D [Dehalobacterium formicoaceticum]|uniref:stage II sporulation protein D n=1 Tax=Dehalobacterium formicoaceticum TaxID=51515 RepID=UPI0031F6049B